MKPKRLVLGLFLLFGLSTFSADAQPFSTLVLFTNSATGLGPVAGLTLSGNSLYGTTFGGGEFGSGTIFSVSTNGTGLKTLYNFSSSRFFFNTDGASPNSPLVVEGNTLYGTTLFGGSKDYGVVFKVNTDGTGFTTLHDFTGEGDFGGPNTLLLSGNTLFGTSAGNIFTVQGDYPIGYGAVFAVNTDGSGFTNLYTFSPTSDSGFNSDGATPTSLLLSGDTLCGMASAGGPSGNGVVFALKTNGANFTLLHSFSALSDGAEPTAGLMLSGTTLYGATQAGGIGGTGVIFAVNTNGTGFKVVHDFWNDPIISPSGLLLSGGTLYGTSYGGSTLYYGALFSLETNGDNLVTLFDFLYSPELIGQNNVQDYDPAPCLTLVGGTLYGTVTDPYFEAGGLFSVGSDVSSLKVTISPLDAWFAGASWHLNGGASLLPDKIVYGLAPGDYAVSFSTITGWTTPSNQIVTLGTNEAVKTSGVYVQLPHPGSLKVTLDPAAAVNAGAAWQVDGGTYESSGATTSNLSVGVHTISFKPIPGWIAPANQSVTIKSGTTTSVIDLYSQAAEGNPKLTITSPKSGQSVVGSNYEFTVTGTTTDKVSVTNVAYQFNGGSWTSATPSNSWSNWTARVTLNPGANTISAYVRDISGTVSATAKVNFKFLPSDPLVVVVPFNENGKVTPDDNGKMLGLGTNFTLTAVPGKNWIFSNWVASGSENFVSNNPVLKFTMQSNLVLTANFVTNVFLAAQGGYYGLFSDTNAHRQQTNSGGFRFNLTSSRAFTGTLLIGPDKPLNLDGAFDVAGEAEVLLKPTTKTSLMVDMQLDFTSQTVSGTVSDGSFVAQLDGYRNVFSSANPAKACEGQYTLIFLGTNDPTVGPYGVSYGTVSVSSAGIVTFGGSLADGTTGLSQSSAISQSGYWPLYLQLYGGAGSLWAWNYLSNNEITGTASWINETNSSKTGVYRAGFTNQAAAIIGSWYSPTNKPLLGFTNGQVLLEQIGASPFAITNQVIISSSDAITVTNIAERTNKLSLTFNKTTGVISGSFANPSNPNQTIKVNGVILQGQTNAQGYLVLPESLYFL